ncbi:hypothetical protein E8E12_002067 [Didymella heteroderae]|uniref:Uncharacterized protein n=1 Tax=Didymella heteroderae TaxID=1769908 RepID=A0A9P4WI98_9PLEO|nr:hypothetical protein E8E12_002067 [Didymella heteroderae]
MNIRSSDFPASVPSLAALPAWVGLEKDGCTPGLRHISFEDTWAARTATTAAALPASTLVRSSCNLCRATPSDDLRLQTAAHRPPTARPPLPLLPPPSPSPSAAPAARASLPSVRPHHHPRTQSCALYGGSWLLTTPADTAPHLVAGETRRAHLASSQTGKQQQQRPPSPTSRTPAPEGPR